VLEPRTVNISPPNSESDPHFARTPLVLMQRKGTKRPFFCVHPGTGTVVSYMHLATELDPDRRFYALQARGFQHDEEPLADIESMARAYVQAITGVESNGPYLLGGYCTGGTIAFEIAQQLRNQGKEVGCLALIDAWAPGASPSCDDARILAKLVKSIVTIPVDRLMQLSLDEQLSDVLTAAARAYGLPTNVNLTAAYRWLRLSLLMERARQTYKPQPYTGKMLLLQARRQPLEYVDDGLMGWRQVTAGNVSLRVVEGDNESLMQPEHLESWIGDLRAALDQAIG